MFPIIWKFLLNQYLKVMVLCAAAFIIVLLTTRLEDIAHFASLDASLSIVLLFVFYQIPYILPIAIPISCLISSILLVQRLSKTHEITAMRACGMGLKDLITPIVIAGALLAVVNFYIVSELATTSHLYTNLWKSELRSVNPLLLLKNKRLMKMHGGYFDVLGTSQMGESASEVVFALPNRSTNRINLLLAKKMEADSGILKSEGVTFLTTLNHKEEGFDPLMIENIDETTITAENFAQMLQKKGWKINNDYLKMPLLLSRINEQKQQLQNANSHSEKKALQKTLNESYSEIFRRISAAVAAFTFTLMGASFGITISRNRSNRSIIYVIFIAAAYLATFFTAKRIEHNLTASFLVYTLPHLAIIALSIAMLRRVSKGIDKG